jgi:hypothetical protein
MAILVFYILFKDLYNAPDDDRYRSKAVALKTVVLRRNSLYLYLRCVAPKEAGNGDTHHQP